MSYKWTISKQKVNPFNSLTGDNHSYEVHLLKVRCLSELEIKHVLEAATQKALSLAHIPLQEQAQKMLFIWDQVYCSLTISFTDDELVRDYSPIVKCVFEGLDAKMWELHKQIHVNLEKETEMLCKSIKAFLIEIVSNIDAEVIPSCIPIMFSTSERSAVSTNELDVYDITR